MCSCGKPHKPVNFLFCQVVVWFQLFWSRLFGVFSLALNLWFSSHQQKVIKWKLYFVQNEDWAKYEVILVKILNIEQQKFLFDDFQMKTWEPEERTRKSRHWAKFIFEWQFKILLKLLLRFILEHCVGDAAVK